MDTDLICRWLDLPVGSWPPDHYTLLGFARGECDPLRAELIVQERMQYLRQFQLTHPELTTEAMNRLAQALLCLTNTAEKEAYDEQLLLASKQSSQELEKVETAPAEVAPIALPGVVAHVAESQILPSIPSDLPAIPPLVSLRTRALLQRIDELRHLGLKNGEEPKKRWLRDYRAAALAEVRLRRKQRAWRRPLRLVGRFYLTHAGTFLTAFGFLALNMASPAFRRDWEWQLVVLAVLVAAKITLFTGGNRQA